MELDVSLECVRTRTVLYKCFRKESYCSLITGEKGKVNKDDLFKHDGKINN